MIFDPEKINRPSIDNEDRHEIVLASDYDRLLALYKASLRKYCEAANAYSSSADITVEEAHKSMVELLP